MDTELKDAACSGDINFLKSALSSKTPNYFLTTFTAKNDDHLISGNIFHLATANYEFEFVREAINILPRSTIHTLLSQKHSTSSSLSNWNPLHLAAYLRCHDIVDLFLNFYSSSSDLTSVAADDPDATRPWLAQTSNGETPLHLALRSNNENCARQILSMDKELLSSMVDNEGNSPLFLAVLKDYKNLAQEIMESTQFYSVSGKDGLSPLHVLHGFDPENIMNKLLKDHPELLTKSYGINKFSVLHSWAAEDKWHISSEITTHNNFIFRNLTCLTDCNGNTPMHIALLQGHDFLASELVQHDKSPLESTILPPPAWLMKNKDGDTPFHLAIKYHSESSVRNIIEKDLRVCYDCNALGESPLFLAVKMGFDSGVQQILELPDYDVTRGNPIRHIDGQTVLHVASNCKEETGNLLVEKFLWLANEPDKNGRRPIDLATEAGTAWLVKLLITKDPSTTKNSPTAWIEGCTKGHLQAILAFINHCPDFRKLCSEQQDSPLHRIKLKGYKEYQELLSISMMQEMLNACDFDDRTPLHRALERKDKIYAEVLLTTKGVERNIHDKYQKTAMGMLKELCDQDDEWESMCKRIGINPRIKTRYIQHTSTMEEVRGTLSIVAALLATLTFAAGFALPGGLNGDTGEATLAKKASFIVFILADAYAMCCAMFVMFIHIWSMVSHQDKALLLIDRSVFIVVQSLYGALLAFMTGVYTVIYKSSLWAGVIIFVTCSLVAISANRRILYFVLHNLIPSVAKERKDQ